MSDLDALKAMLSRCGVEYEEMTTGPEVEWAKGVYPSVGSVLYLEGTHWTFDADGRLIEFSNDY